MKLWNTAAPGRQVDQRPRADRLRSRLEPLGLLDLAPIATQRVGLGDGKVDEQRGDPVAELQVLARGADVDRDHRPQPLRRGRLAALQQQLAQAPGGGREDDVVDRPSERILDLLQLVEGHANRPPARRCLRSGR